MEIKNLSDLRGFSNFQLLNTAAYFADFLDEEVLLQEELLQLVDFLAAEVLFLAELEEPALHEEDLQPLENCSTAIIQK